MDFIKSFLENSTIHGLSYISTTRKYSRVIWIFIVILAFSFAGVMINLSFNNWADNPIKTTIKTQPITKLTLPKVTVCPPKNTFTNLNYDLMLLENMLPFSSTIWTGWLLTLSMVSVSETRENMSTWLQLIVLPLDILEHLSVEGSFPPSDNFSRLERV